MTLSDKATRICAEYYEKACGACPIRRECVSSAGYGREGYEIWIQSINTAAEGLESAM